MLLGALLTSNGAPGNIQGNLTSTLAAAHHIQDQLGVQKTTLLFDPPDQSVSEGVI